MYDWVRGRPSLLLRTHDLEIWPGGPPAPGSPELRPEPRSFVTVVDFEGSSMLAVFTEALTTAVPLELGGLLLVSASYCDDDASVADHLDLVPIGGWQVLPKRFVAVGEDYVLFDGGLKGLDVTDPRKEEADNAEEKALQAAAQAWYGSDFGDRAGEREDFWLALAWGGAEPFDAQFEALAQQVWLPLYRQLQPLPH